MARQRREGAGDANYGRIAAVRAFEAVAANNLPGLPVRAGLQTPRRPGQACDAAFPILP